MFELERVVELEGERRRVDAALARVLAQLEEDQTCDIEHGMRTGAWFARECGLKPAECVVRVKISVRLVTTFPVLLAALEAGRVSWAHVQFICQVANPRVTADVVELQDALIVLAGEVGFTQWEHDVRAIIDNLDRDGGHDPDTDRVSRAKLAATLGGAVLKGWFTDDLSIPMDQAIETKADQLYRNAQKTREACDEYEIPARSELRAMAIAELIALGSGRTWDQTQPNRPECTLLLRPETDEVTTVDGIVLTPTARKLLLNDAKWGFLRFDRRGSALDWGRNERYAPHALRVALAARDGACVFKGCEHPAQHCDAHHVHPWDDGGETNIENTALLCRFHHGVTHRLGWQMSCVGDQWFQWTTPTGQIIESQRHRRPRPDHDRQPQPQGA